MKRFIVAVVLLTIVCSLLSDEAMGSAPRNKRNVDQNPSCPTARPTPGMGICVDECGPGLDECIGGKICCHNGCGHTCVDPVY